MMYKTIVHGLYEKSKKKSASEFDGSLNYAAAAASKQNRCAFNEMCVGEREVQTRIWSTHLTRPIHWVHPLGLSAAHVSVRLISMVTCELKDFVTSSYVHTMQLTALLYQHCYVHACMHFFNVALLCVLQFQCRRNHLIFCARWETVDDILY